MLFAGVKGEFMTANQGATGWSNPLISFWHAGAPIGLPIDSLPSAAEAAAEVIVVGAGLLGSCTAYWLARRGVRVVVLEQEAPAFGATGRNGGFHVVGTAESYAGAIARHGHAVARAIYQITLDSRSLVRQVLAEEQFDCEYREPGRINLALSPEDHAAQAASIAAMNADGFAQTLLDRAQVQELVGTPLGEQIVGGSYNDEDGMLQPAMFVQGILGAARRHGARLCHAKVLGIAPDGSGVRISTDRGDVVGGAVVIAVNAWSSQIVPALQGVIIPVRGQILNYAPLAHVFPAGMGAAYTPTGEYWHQTPDGSIVLGGCRAAAADGEFGLLAEGTTEVVQQALDRVFPSLFPQLSGLNVVRRWSGPMAFTSDYTPIADRVPGIAAGWFVGGFCGHGMPFGMRVGQLLAEAAHTGSTPAALMPLRLDRPTLASSTHAH
jgi:glycine/D-amino acid oxidase-like deaminating enzyme